MSDTDTIVISPYLKLQTTGEVSGLPCGRRPSGVTVARQGEAQNVHVLYPKTHAKVIEASIAPMVLQGVQAKEAGRIWVAKDSPVLGTIVEHVVATIDAAKAVKRTAPVVFPALAGVTAVVEDGEVVVRMEADRDALAGIKGGVWDETRDAFVAPASKAKAIATALKDLAVVRVEREVKAAKVAKAEAWRLEVQAKVAEEGRLARVLAERLRGREGGRMALDGQVVLDFPYDADLVALARSLPGARYLSSSHEWLARASEEAHVDIIVTAASQIAQALPALKAAKQAERSRRAEERRQEEIAWRRANPYFISRCYRAPQVGETWRFSDDREVVVVIRHGRPFRADDDLSSMGGPIGAEGEWCCRVYYRAATAAETAALEGREGAAMAQVKAVATVREIVARVDRDGEDVELGREPEGEIMWRSERSSLYGYSRRLVLDSTGALWTVTYDGSDGGTWGMYNLGYNTRGRRLRVTAEEVEVLRRAIAAAGDMA